eukprot:6643048-Pyramimonas_sp.AAC.1
MRTKRQKKHDHDGTKLAQTAGGCLHDVLAIRRRPDSDPLDPGELGHDAPDDGILHLWVEGF